MSSTKTTWLDVADMLETSTVRKQVRKHIPKTKNKTLDNQTAALMVCSAIGSTNIDDMAAVLAAMPETERQTILDMAARLKGTVRVEIVEGAALPQGLAIYDAEKGTSLHNQKTDYPCKIRTK